MYACLPHGYHGIDWGDESGTVAPRVACLVHYEMPACRETYHAYEVGVDTIVGGVLVEVLHGALPVVVHIGMTYAAKKIAVACEPCHPTRHTIAQHEGRDALLLEPAAHFMPFAFDVEPVVTAAGTYYYRHAAALCDVWRKCYSLGFEKRGVFIKRNCLLCYHKIGQRKQGNK